MHVSSHNGLLVAENSVDGRAVSAALKKINPDLRLLPVEMHEDGMLLYKVFLYQGPDRRAAFVCAWTDDYGRPLPLSHRLIDKVNSLRPDAPTRQPDMDEQNDRHRDRVLKEFRDATREVTEDIVRRASVGRNPVLHRGVGLRRARDKRRGRGENV